MDGWLAITVVKLKCDQEDSSEVHRANKYSVCPNFLKLTRFNIVFSLQAFLSIFLGISTSTCFTGYHLCFLLTTFGDFKNKQLSTVL